MKTAKTICKIIMLLLGSFFIFMSFDSFDTPNATVLELVGGFLINSSPGIVLIALTCILWKKEKMLGVIILIGAVGLFFLFKFYRDTNEKWLTILIVEVPMLVVGGLLLGHREK